MCFTYDIVRMLELNLVLLHRAMYALESVEQVGKYGDFPLSSLRSGEAF